MDLKKYNVKTKRNHMMERKMDFQGGGEVDVEHERDLMKKLGIWRVSKRKEFEMKTTISCCKDIKKKQKTISGIS